MAKLTKKDLKLLESHEKLLKKMDDMMEKYGKTVADVHKKEEKYYGDAKGSLGTISKKVGRLQGALEKIKKTKDPLQVSKAEKYKEKLGDIKSQVILLHGEMKKGKNITQDQVKKLKELERGFQKVEKEAQDLVKSTQSWEDAASRSGPAFLKNFAKFRKSAREGTTPLDDYGKLLGKAGTKLGKMPGLFKGAGKAAKGMGAAVGRISKAIMGWPMLIALAVKAAIDLTRAADQFVKDANKAFASIRGPDIMTGDIAKQFKDFNNQIYKAGENIRVGMDVTQIRELLDAVYQAGANITQLNKGLMTYRDAIYVASKASKTLGMELPQVGNAMGKMMMDMRMDLDSIDKAFIQVAFDAKKSGLSTDRFWTTVQNASASLALYGVVVKTASATMKAFTENAVGGADDAADATENMFDVFKNGGLKAQMAIMDFAREGGKSVKTVFKTMSEEAGKQVENIEGEIKLIEGKKGKRTSEEADQLKKLRSDLYAAQSKQSRFEKAAEGGKAAQAAEAAALAKDAPHMIIAALKGQIKQPLHKVASNQLLALVQSAKQLGLNEKTTRMIVEISKVTEKRMADLASKSATYFNLSGKSDKDTREGIASAITSVTTSTGDAQIKAADALQVLLQDKLDMMPDLAADMVKLIKSDEKGAEKITKYLKSGNENMASEISKVVISNRAIEAMTAAHFKDQEKTEGEMASAADDTLKGVVKQTLSYNEMIKIAKDEVQWRLSSLSIFQGLNTAVNNILGVLIKDNQLTQSQKLAQEQIKATLASGTTLKELSHLAGRDNLSSRDQIALTRKVQEELAETKAAIETKTVVGATIGQIKETGDDPAKVLESTIGTLKDSLKKPDISDEQKRQNEALITEYQKVSDEITKMQGTEKWLQKISSDLVKGDKTAGRSLETTIAKMTASGDESVKPIMEKILKIYESKVIPKGSKQAKIDEEIKKLTATKLDKIEQSNQKNIDTGKDQVTELEEAEERLGELNKSNTTIATLARLQLQSSPEYLEKLKEEVETQRKVQKKSFKQISADLGIPLEDIKKSYEGEEGKGVVPKKLYDAIQEQKTQEEVMSKDLPGLQGLKKPITITKEGVVTLHAGEKVLPKSTGTLETDPSMSAGMAPYPSMPSLPEMPIPDISIPTLPEMSIPAITETPRVAGAGGGGAGDTPAQTINIQVDATEKDLAGRIANQIKKELYSRSIATSSYSLS